MGLEGLALQLFGVWCGGYRLAWTQRSVHEEMLIFPFEEILMIFWLYLDDILNFDWRSRNQDIEKLPFVDLP
jgi:hypothetical protein